MLSLKFKLQLITGKQSLSTIYTGCSRETGDYKNNINSNTVFM